MPHYFFHVHNEDRSFEDGEGDDFDNFALAEHEAEMSIRDLIVEAIKFGDPVTVWKIEITDADGRVLGLVPASKFLH